MIVSCTCAPSASNGSPRDATPKRKYTGVRPITGPRDSRPERDAIRVVHHESFRAQIRQRAPRHPLPSGRYHRAGESIVADCRARVIRRVALRQQRVAESHAHCTAAACVGRDRGMLDDVPLGTDRGGVTRVRELRRLQHVAIGRRVREFPADGEPVLSGVDVRANAEPEPRRERPRGREAEIVDRAVRRVTRGHLRGVRADGMRRERRRLPRAVEIGRECHANSEMRRQSLRAADEREPRFRRVHVTRVRVRRAVLGFQMEEEHAGAPIRERRRIHGGHRVERRECARRPRRPAAVLPRGVPEALASEHTLRRSRHRRECHQHARENSTHHGVPKRVRAT